VMTFGIVWAGVDHSLDGRSITRSIVWLIKLFARDSAHVCAPWHKVWWN
jgi:hypothetical protein